MGGPVHPPTADRRPLSLSGVLITATDRRHVAGSFILNPAAHGGVSATGRVVETAGNARVLSGRVVVPPAADRSMGSEDAVVVTSNQSAVAAVALGLTENQIVGAGAIIVKNIADNSKYVSTPAKKMD